MYPGVSGGLQNGMSSPAAASIAAGGGWTSIRRSMLRRSRIVLAVRTYYAAHLYLTHARTQPSRGFPH